MTKQEFEARYGKEVSGYIFDNINELYMLDDNIDKDTFVKDFKKHEDSILFQSCFDKCQKQAKVIDNLKERINYLVDVILNQASETYNEHLEDIAITQIGAGAVKERKLTLGLM